MAMGWWAASCRRPCGPICSSSGRWSGTTPTSSGRFSATWPGIMALTAAPRGWPRGCECRGFRAPPAARNALWRRRRARLPRPAGAHPRLARVRRCEAPARRRAPADRRHEPAGASGRRGDRPAPRSLRARRRGRGRRRSRSPRRRAPARPDRGRVRGPAGAGAALSPDRVAGAGHPHRGRRGDVREPHRQAGPRADAAEPLHLLARVRDGALPACLRARPEPRGGHRRLDRGGSPDGRDRARDQARFPRPRLLRPAARRALLAAVQPDQVPDDAPDRGPPLRVGAGQLGPDHPVRALAAPLPARRAAAAAQHASRRHEPGGPAAPPDDERRAAPADRPQPQRGVGRRDLVLLAALLGPPGHHRLGAGAVPLRELTRAGSGEDPLRLLLPQAPVGPARRADSPRDGPDRPVGAPRSPRPPGRGAPRDRRGRRPRGERLMARVVVTAADLQRRIAERSARIGIIGQGYVGLPLAVELARVGFAVTGFDTSADRVLSLNAGRSHTPDVADDTLRARLEVGRYEATTNLADLADCDAVIICVPTPLRKSKDPDISFVAAAAQEAAAHFRAAQLVILESTTYPGTTQELLAPMFEARGGRPGVDCFLAFSPERIDPANAAFAVKDIPKVVGGLTPACAALAALLYRQIVERVMTVSSPRVAELAKLYENVFRNVNIALANELALMCRQLGVSTREVIQAAATKPFGFMPFYPGPGIGGHCIGVDPAYLAWRMRLNGYEARFIHVADEINRAMPQYVVDLVTESLNARRRCLNGARILALGMAYKRGVGDTRESPALEVVARLMDRGASVAYADPHVPEIAVEGRALKAVEVTDERLAEADCVVILTDHPEFDYPRIVARSALVVDTRGATHGLAAPADRVVAL